MPWHCGATAVRDLESAAAYSRCRRSCQAAALCLLGGRQAIRQASLRIGSLQACGLTCAARHRLAAPAYAASHSAGADRRLIPLPGGCGLLRTGLARTASACAGCHGAPALASCLSRRRWQLSGQGPRGTGSGRPGRHAPVGLGLCHGPPGTAASTGAAWQSRYWPKLTPAASGRTTRFTAGPTASFPQLPSGCTQTAPLQLVQSGMACYTGCNDTPGAVDVVKNAPIRKRIRRVSKTHCLVVDGVNNQAGTAHSLLTSLYFRYVVI